MQRDIAAEQETLSEMRLWLSESTGIEGQRIAAQISTVLMLHDQHGLPLAAPQLLGLLGATYIDGEPHTLRIV